MDFLIPEANKEEHEHQTTVTPHGGGSPLFPDFASSSLWGKYRQQLRLSGKILVGFNAGLKTHENFPGKSQLLTVFPSKWRGPKAEEERTARDRLKYDSFSLHPPFLYFRIWANPSENHGDSAIFSKVETFCWVYNIRYFSLCTYVNPENLNGEAKILESDPQAANENFSVLLSGNNQQFG
jgi:hypothetical protein